MKKQNLLYLIMFAATACGVKGDPVPPGTPAEISRGKPKFEGIAGERRRPLLIQDNQKKDASDEEDEND